MVPLRPLLPSAANALSLKTLIQKREELAL
jgi:hypothetical protein